MAPARPLPSLQKALIGLSGSIQSIRKTGLTVLTGVEWGSDRRKSTIDAKVASYSRLAGDVEGGVLNGKNAHSLRTMGSASLNYAMVAQGCIDIYWYVLKIVL